MPPTEQQRPDFDFIVNPTPPPKRNLFTDASLPKRIAFIGGSLVILFVLFSIIKGVVSGPSDVDLYVSVAQEQQQIIHIASQASTQQGLSSSSLNSALTTAASITTDQSATLTYMQKNGKKVNVKTLAKGVSASIDEQFTASAAAGTYDQTYKSVMEQQLQAYARHLQQVYKQTGGAKGHALLTSNYKSAQLLEKQLQAQ
jgi:hypothetical protein